MNNFHMHANDPARQLFGGHGSECPADGSCLRVEAHGEPVFWAADDTIRTKAGDIVRCEHGLGGDPFCARCRTKRVGVDLCPCFVPWGMCSSGHEKPDPEQQEREAEQAKETIKSKDVRIAEQADTIDKQSRYIKALEGRLRQRTPGRPGRR